MSAFESRRYGIDCLACGAASAGHLWCVACELSGRGQFMCGAAAAFGLMGMAEAIRTRPRVRPCSRTIVIGSQPTWCTFPTGHPGPCGQRVLGRFEDQ